MNQLILNLALNTLIFFLAYRWLLQPLLLQFAPSRVLTAILLLHAMRHMGLMFLATGVVQPGMPASFAVPAAVGDFLAATLALTAATLIQRKSSKALVMTWVFNIVGSLDFMMAITLSRIFTAGDFLGAAYWIPVFWVPMLIVGHGVIFQILRGLKRDGKTLAA